jgi:hypothetical protein
MHTALLTWLKGPAWAVGATLVLWGILFLSFKVRGKRLPHVAVPAQGERVASLAGLKAQIEKGRMGANMALVAAMGTPLIFAVAYGVVVFFQSTPLAAEGVAMAGTLGLIMWGCSVLKWRATGRDLSRVRWLHDAKVMVADRVSELKLRGFTVFTDCHLGDRAIDHILVGPKGVFVVQTAVGMGAFQADLNTHGTATYDGRALFFPGKEDHETVSRACEDAEKLSEWLCEALDIPLAARAIVALPGWRIKRTSAEGISVIHPTQFEALFQYVRPRPLTTEEAALISERVEQLCTSHVPSVLTTVPAAPTADLRHRDEFPE